MCIASSWNLPKSCSTKRHSIFYSQEVHPGWYIVVFKKPKDRVSGFRAFGTEGLSWNHCLSLFSCLGRCYGRHAGFEGLNDASRAAWTLLKSRGLWLEIWQKEASGVKRDSCHSTARVITEDIIVHGTDKSQQDTVCVHLWDTRIKNLQGIVAWQV